MAADPNIDAHRRSNQGPGLIDRLLQARDRLLASETFQTKAAAFPLSRPIARARARKLFDLCAGFVYSQVLYACVQLRLFDKLLEKPLTLSEIEAKCALPRDACEQLITAAQALQLVERRSQNRYGLGPLGAALADNPALTQMIEHHDALYRDLADPLALLRNDTRITQLSGFWPYAGAEDPTALKADDVDTYSQLMTRSQPLIAAEVLDAYPVSRHRVLMDVGGGEGAFLAAAAQRAPDLRLKLFDLPAVAERAKPYLTSHGLAARSEVFGGDFFRDALPSGADLITLVRVVLDHADEKILKLLRAARKALPPEGTLLIAEALSEPETGSRMGAVYFGFYLRAMGRGRPRTPAEIISLCKAAGFNSVHHVRTHGALDTGIILARPS